MNKKLNIQTVEELTKNELSAIENSDKLAKLSKESVRDKKIIAEFKEREKSSARALVLYERKIKYLKQVFASEILSLSERFGENSEIQNKFREVFDDDEIEFTEILSELNGVNQKLQEMAERLQSIASISKSDRDFILNKQTQTAVNANETVEDRFNRLKQEFSQKIGSSVNRKRGRPKKGEQSIVADIGLGKKPEKKVDSANEIETKFNDLFYGSPAGAVGASSALAIPQTDDSLFDFNEALNPNISLKDIMADIMSDKNDDTTFAGSFELKSEPVKEKESKKTNEKPMMTEIEMIESGYIHAPRIQKRTSNKSMAENEKKKSDFEKHFFPLSNIMRDNK